MRQAFFKTLYWLLWNYILDSGYLYKNILMMVILKSLYVRLGFKAQRKATGSHESGHARYWGWVWQKLAREGRTPDPSPRAPDPWSFHSIALHCSQVILWTGHASWHLEHFKGPITLVFRYLSPIKSLTRVPIQNVFFPNLFVPRSQLSASAAFWLKLVATWPSPDIPLLLLQAE